MKKIIIKTVTGMNLIIIVILVNVILKTQYLGQFDLSSNKIHTLSSSTVETIKQLDDVINISVYQSEGLPSEIKSSVSSLRFILNSFQKINPNKIKIVYKNPSGDSEVRNEVTKLGIRELQFSSVKNDKLEVQSGFFGMMVAFGDKKEVLPVASDIGNMEYYLASVIKKLTSDTKPNILIALENKQGVEDNYKYLKTFLEKEYSVNIINPTVKSNFPSQVSTIIVIGMSKWEPDNLNKLRNLIDSGKGVIAMLDKVEIGVNLQTNKINDTNLEKLFEEYGIKVLPKLVMDESAVVANFQSQGGALYVKYPYWIQIRPENLDQKLPIFSGINSIMMAWASPLELSVNAKSIIKSSLKSWTDENFISLVPTNIKTDDKTVKQQYSLAAIDTDNKKVIVFGDNDFIKDQFVVNSQQNLLFILNAVDYFSTDSSLLTIRSKTIQFFPIKDINTNTKNLVKYGSLVCPVVILLIIAGGIHAINKRKINRWKNTAV